MENKCTDNDILAAFMNHTNYLNEECGINPMYSLTYQPTAEEIQDLPISPLFNWWMY